ncbi:MAG: type I 3-dehydroquinate dehydratase [Phycisphaerae bacterium]
MPPKTLLICSLCSEDVETMRRGIAGALGDGADGVELRLDALKTPPSNEALRGLIDAAGGRTVIVTYRPRREGGQYDGDDETRLAVLARAAELGADYIDVEYDVPSRNWPEASVIVSRHDFRRVPEDLGRMAADMESSSASIKKIAFMGAGPEDALRALDLLRAGRKPTVALSMGESGALSRIAAGKFGAFCSYASATAGTEAAPGQLTVRDLRQTYRWDAVGPETRLFGVIGCPVGHSMSPAIHNAAFDATGYDGLYVPLRIEPGRENFFRFMDALLSRPWTDWRGLSVTIPHKEHALAYVGAENCDELCARIGAVNTVTIDSGGVLRGDNTDYAAALDALCSAMGIEREELSGRSIAVLGAGGASRALVAALAYYGADVTVHNRTLGRAERLAGEFGAAAKPLDAADGTDAEILINCTPIGMHSHERAGESPLAKLPESVKVVFDTIYNPPETPLLTQARDAGCTCVSGLEMFVNQAVRQFEIWTGRQAPRDAMRDVVVRRLTGA